MSSAVIKGPGRELPGRALAGGPIAVGARVTGSTGLRRLAARVAVLGGIAAQLSQALGSLALQIIAARLLGAEGLGAFAVLYGVMIIATAVCSGLVGDSLTVLDRSRPDIRAALQNWLLMLSVGGGLVAFTVAETSGLLTSGEALVFAAATAVFLVEDALRRLLMAGLKFWRIVAVDLTSLCGSLGALVVVTAAGGGPSLGALVLSLLVGQSAAIVVGVALVPRADRWLARPAVGAMGAVAGYGSWRAAQQFLRPGMLSAMRLVVVAGAGLATVGALEAARIYTAPMLLVVNGTSSFLFASYAASRTRQSTALLRRADRGVLALFIATTVMSAAAVAAIGLIGPVLTGGSVQLSVTAVVGWSAFAVSVAAVTPYGALAAVRRRQAAVLGLRTADSVLSLTVVAALVVAGVDPEWVPLALAACSLAGGVAIRQFLLVRGSGVSDDATERSNDRKAERTAPR